MRRALLALPFVVMAACTYDWTVGPPSGSSGSVADAGSGDATSSTDAPVEGGGDCNGLEVQMNLARTRILGCSNGQCAGTVKDECKCDLAVGNATSADAQTYANAAAAYAAAGCAKCSGSCNGALHLCVNGSVCA